MTEFLFEYGLFAVKALTLVVLFLIIMVGIASVLAARHRDKESLEVENLNDHFDSLQEVLESEVLDKADYKKCCKGRKKKHKKEKKATKKRLFVIKFNGDMEASEVNNLRKSITALLTVATEKDEVVVILESAGGVVHNYGLAASQLVRIRERNIHLTACVDLVAASGGYLMACIANKIIAAPFAIVGSIGVLAQVPNFNRLLSKFDVDIEHHTAGKHKSTLTMFGKNTPESREKFLEELEITHKLFKDFVKNYRPQLNIEKIATGEHWYGTNALELELIDAIQTSDDYLLEKAKNIDIYEVNYQIRESIKDKISTMLSDAAANLLHKFGFVGKILRCYNI